MSSMGDLALNGDTPARYRPPTLPPDEPIEVGRYASALRRSWLLILLIVVPLTGAVFLVSLALPKTYQATAKIVVESGADPLATRDAESVERRLATIQVLLTTRQNLRRAARTFEGVTAATLADKVDASVDPTANIVSVQSTHGNALGAAQIANAVATSFLATEGRAEQRRINRARATLNRALAELKGVRGLQPQEERAAIRERLTDLNFGAASAGSELTLAEAARPPSEAYSPRPVRNAIFAFFAAAFIAALVVLARAQLKPRLTGSRELSRLLDLPVLVEIPYVRRRPGPKTLAAVEYEAYQTLQASLRRQLPATHQRTVLITSALHSEGKTEVTAALGLVLSHARLRTWLVSADMRWPRLHELFDVAQTPGLAEVLSAARRDGSKTASQMTAARTGLLDRETEAGSLHVLASGRTPADPAQLLASDALDGFFDEIKESEYDYVLLDGPPLLGLVDSQVLAQRVDGMLIVCRLDRMTPENAIALRELLDRLDVKPLGLVIVGGRGPHPSYLEG